MLSLNSPPKQTNKQNKTPTTVLSPGHGLIYSLKYILKLPHTLHLNLFDVGGSGGRGRECSSHSCLIFSFISSSLTSLNSFCPITCPPREEKRRTYLYIFIVVLCLFLFWGGSQCREYVFPTALSLEVTRDIRAPPLRRRMQGASTACD